jgi:hypothetical protein
MADHWVRMRPIVSGAPGGLVKRNVLIALLYDDCCKIPEGHHVFLKKSLAE